MVLRARARGGSLSDELIRPLTDIPDIRPAIVLDGLSVHYGRKVALEGVTLKVPRGSVYALLGRNGAGKSAAVRIGGAPWAIGGQPSDHEVVVATKGRAVIVDIAAGSSHAVPEGLWPALLYDMHQMPRSRAARLYFNSAGDLVEVGATAHTLILGPP